MNTTPSLFPSLWLETLAAAGARLAADASAVLDFGDAEHERASAESGSVLAPLADGLLRFEGADGAKLLNGQLSNDIQNLNETQSVLAGFATPQGRLRAIVRAFHHDGALYLQLPAGLVDAVHAEFRKFAPLYRQLKLSVASGELALLGLSGPEAEAALTAEFPVLPAEAGCAVAHAGLTLIRLAGVAARFELIASAQTLAPVFERLRARLTPIGSPAWELTEIAAGLPQVYPETAGAYLPLHLNLQLVGGIHWKKGCYTGQEIIARMHYRSTLKRHAYRAHVQSESVPAPGTPLIADGQEAGSVIRAAAASGGRVEMLVELPNDTVRSAVSRLGDANGPILHIGELPYALVASYQSGNA